MAIVRILLRKDSASVVVAIVLGLVLAQFIYVISLEFSTVIGNWINQEVPVSGAGYDWRESLFDPTMLLIIQVLVLEFFLRLAVGLRKLVIKLRSKR